MEAWLPPLPSPTSRGDLDKCPGFPGHLKGLIGGQHQAIWSLGPPGPTELRLLSQDCSRNTVIESPWTAFSRGSIPQILKKSHFLEIQVHIRNDNGMAASQGLQAVQDLAAKKKKRKKERKKKKRKKEKEKKERNPVPFC